MCTYCNTKYYHKIYENHIGSIPNEANGRTYEIHHIDGNHSNNLPSNLTAVTLQEHYDIHYAQGDFGACYLMTIQRMNKTPKEISELANKHALQRIATGTHHFLDSEWHTNENIKRVENGIHPWLGGQQSRKNNQKMLKEGTHPLTKRPDGTSVASDLVAAGTHPLLKRADGTSVASDLVAAGTHHLLGPNANLKRLENGTHPSQIKVSCIYCYKAVSISNFKRWHGSNCKLNNNMNPENYPEYPVYPEQEEGDDSDYKRNPYAPTYRTLP